ncbi:MAG TPA: hypothetical protein VIX59_04545 [Candidatus Binataceae bacterium]
MPSLAFLILMTALVGLGTGQKARVDLLYPPAPAAADFMVLTHPPSPCVTEVDFFDANSNKVLSKQVSLSPGQSSTVTLTRTQLGAKTTDNHTLFYAEASIVNTCGTDSTCDATLCDVIPNAETVDPAGQTGVLINGVRGPLIARLGPAAN